MINTAITTPVYLTEEQAKLFVVFQQRFAFLQLMDSLGVFNVRSGTVSINFDPMGRIGSVDILQHFRQPVDKAMDKPNL